MKKKLLSLFVAVVVMITAFLMPVRAETQKKNVGNFVWVWQVQNLIDNHGGNIDELIAYLKSLHINNICIKFHEGSGTSGGQTDFRADFYKYKDAFKQAGIKVGSWGYNYFNYPQQEANLIIEALHNSDYYVYDPEGDVSNKAEQTEEVCRAVREACPDSTIGYASFPVASYHQNINYSAFNRYCDFSAPQIYWEDMQWSANRAIDRTIKDYKEYSLNIPMFPAIQGYNISMNDYETFKKYNFGAYSVWSLDSLDSNGAKFISQNSSPVSVPVNNSSHNDESYSANATVRGDWLYARNWNSSIQAGHRVDEGDKVKVLDVSYSRQLALVKYPTSSGSRESYVKNCSCIEYTGATWENGHTVELVYDKPGGAVIGKLNPWERATKLSKQGNWTNVVYDTCKGKNTKSGFVAFEGM